MTKLQFLAFKILISYLKDIIVFLMSYDQEYLTNDFKQSNLLAEKFEMLYKQENK